MINEMNKATGVVEKKVCGVLTDYDLSSWTASLTTDYTRTSNQRTGTPPFMAHGLLDGTDTLHMYRHDVESLFYVILILATHYEIQAPEDGEAGGVRMREGKPRFQGWFDAPDYETLGEKKSAFLSNFKPLDLSPTFEGLRGWLVKLRISLGFGYIAKQQQKALLEAGRTNWPLGNGIPAVFDNETLGGHVTYPALIGPVGNLTGGLEGLAIRYTPKSPPTPTGTS